MDVKMLTEREVEHKIAVLNGKLNEIVDFMFVHERDVDKKVAKKLEDKVKEYRKKAKPLTAHYKAILKSKAKEAERFRMEAVRAHADDLVAKHCDNANVTRVNGVGVEDDE